MEPQKIEHVLDPACPWFSLKNIRLPKIKWCEEQLCSWIENPADAWSNLGYILVGMIMHALSRNLKSRPLRFYGTASILVGVSSFIYHASNNFIMQIFDFFGMYVFAYLLLFINLERLGKKVMSSSLAIYWIAVLGTTLATVLADFTTVPIQGFVFILIVLIIATEITLRKNSDRSYSMKNFYLSFTFQGIAAVCSTLDLKRIVCDPSNHWFQGHAMWHLFGSIALLFSFFHHRQFDEALAKNESART